MRWSSDADDVIRYIFLAIAAIFIIVMLILHGFTKANLINIGITLAFILVGYITGWYFWF